MKSRTRCPWASSDDALMQKYHDTEWGVPLHDDKKIFEFLCLESFQAGLSWRTILHKRKNFEKAFVGFSPARVAAFVSSLARVGRVSTVPPPPRTNPHRSYRRRGRQTSRKE